MKAKSMKICLGISTGLAVVALGSFFIMQNQAAERSVYINQTLESGIESAVSDTVAPSKGVLELDGDGDGVADIYMDMGSFKNALKLASEQIDANTSNIAASNDVYDNTATYSVGDLCIYNGLIYQCISAIETAEEWTEGHWAPVSLTGEMNEINDSFSSINNNLANGQVKFSVESDGAYVTYNVGADTVTKKLGSGVPMCPIRVDYYTAQQSGSVIGCITSDGTFNACSENLMSKITETDISNAVLVKQVSSSASCDEGSCSSYTQCYYYANHANKIEKNIVIEIYTKASVYYNSDSDGHDTGASVTSYVQFAKDGTVNILSALPSNYTKTDGICNYSTGGGVNKQGSCGSAVYIES